MAGLGRYLRDGPRPVWLRYLLIIAFASGIIRLILRDDWMRSTSILYVLIPYLVGVAIYIITPQPKGVGYGIRLWSHMRAALIVMLSTSLLLFEGFLCVLMFLPIYFFFAMIVVATSPFYDKPVGIDEEEERNRISDTFRLSAVPLLILFLSLDGIRGMGPDRHTMVSRTAVIPLSAEQIQANIIDHDYPDEGRSWFLSLFPRPVAIDAKSLHVGARHTGHWEYRRWGMPGLNVHKGTSVLEFTTATPDHLHANIVHDDSYLSHYMRFKTWDMRFTPHQNGGTEVTLTVTYDRKLAPAWYFGPMQKKVVRDGLDYALAEIIQ